MQPIQLKPCPFCGGTNVHMLDPEQVDAVSWICAIECQDCEITFQPAYCEPDVHTAQYSARVDWNRRPDTAIPADQVLVPRELLETIEKSWRIPYKKAAPLSERAELAISEGLCELRTLLQR